MYFYQKREYRARYAWFSICLPLPADPNCMICTCARWEEKRVTCVEQVVYSILPHRYSNLT